MKKLSFIILLLVLVVTISGIIYYSRVIRLFHHDIKKSNEPYQRIISLSPNVTEILFALGLGDKIVGVTRYCSYPLKAQEKAKVGGYLDPNYEAILQLKPDVVIILPEFEQIKNFLSELGIKHLTVSNKTIIDILSSIEFLGKEFGVEKEAETILTEINATIHGIEAKIKDSKRPAVLICIERTMGTGAVEDVYVAGKNTFYDELIHYAGGNNAFQDDRLAYPLLSAEGIISLNPEFIIDLIPHLEQTGLSAVAIKNDWDSIAQVEAVKNHHAYILSQDYTVIPGPRFILFLEDLARIIHPEVDWSFDR